MLCLSRNPQSGHSGPGSGSAGLGFLLNSIHLSPTRNLMDERGNSYGVVPGGSGGLAYIVVLVLVVILVGCQWMEGVVSHPMSFHLTSQRGHILRFWPPLPRPTSIVRGLQVDVGHLH